MEAKLARKLAIESCNDEIEKISYAIEEAAKQGYTAITCNDLQQGTKSWLIENGYDLIEQTLESHTIYQIKWD